MAILKTPEIPAEAQGVSMPESEPTQDPDFKGDKEWGQQRLAAAKKTRDLLRDERMQSVNLIVYKLDYLIKAEAEVEIWEKFVEGGWDSLAGEIGTIIRQGSNPGGGSPLKAYVAQVQIHAAQQVWRKYWRQAIREGVLIEILVGVL
jgi:hypothetical protein